jgi:hypothetical protein
VMGYPMTWFRLVNRNSLHGDYDGCADCSASRGCIAGDMRRLEADSRDDAHLRMYATLAGVTPEQAKVILDAFFGAP